MTPLELAEDLLARCRTPQTWGVSRAEVEALCQEVIDQHVEIVLLRKHLSAALESGCEWIK